MTPKKLALYAALFISLCALISAPASAQTRLKTTGMVQQGQFVDLGGSVTAPADSLQVTDTTAYNIPLTHVNELNPYFSWEWTKVGSGTATITLSFTQSNDNINFFPVLKGVAQTAYTKSYSLAASTASEVEFWRDTALVSARYLKVTWITSSTASVKGYVHGRLKTNIR